MIPAKDSNTRVIKAISLHDFKNQELLGEGCFGQVYKAEWVPDREKCKKAGKRKQKGEKPETNDEVKGTVKEDTKEMDKEEVKELATEQSAEIMTTTEEAKETVKEAPEMDKEEGTKEPSTVAIEMDKEEVKELTNEEPTEVANEEGKEVDKEVVPAKDNEEVSVEVAIKVLKNASSQQVLAERDRLAIADHENVVKLLGVVHLWRGSTIAPWLVMENLPLGNLRQYIIGQRNTGGICANGMMKIAWGIARGMEYLHSNGIIHGDLATRNCILGHKWTVKIGDLGYYDDKNSRYYHDYKQSNIICPVRWMAPENLPYRANRAGNMVPCRPRQSFAGDVWAYGVVLYELWSRAKDPFHKLNNTYDVCDALLQCVVPSNFQKLKVRRHIWNLMHHCWEFMPSARPKATGVVDHFEVHEPNVWLMANDYISM